MEDDGDAKKQKGTSGAAGGDDKKEKAADGTAGGDDKKEKAPMERGRRIQQQLHIMLILKQYFVEPKQIKLIWKKLEVLLQQED